MAKWLWGGAIVWDVAATENRTEPKLRGDDKLIDATADQFEDDFAYSEGVASKFLTPEPSPRAVKIILRVGAAGLTL